MFSFVNGGAEGISVRGERALALQGGAGPSGGAGGALEIRSGSTAAVSLEVDASGGEGKAGAGGTGGAGGEVVALSKGGHATVGAIGGDGGAARAPAGAGSR